MVNRLWLGCFDLFVVNLTWVLIVVRQVCCYVGLFMLRCLVDLNWIAGVGGFGSLGLGLVAVICRV